ncbi:hypothetical protein FOZ62_000378, partial [Perkinsus olseni]
DVLAALTPDGDDGLRSLGCAHRLHGTSLAVAEMLRRLGSTALAFDSPESLESLLDKVARPAFECQGLAAARDAACFVLWAVARGVCDQEIVSRNLDMILRLLVCSSLLDPNIVVRRAASAAAQEVVGRLGCTTADDAGFLFVNLVDYWTVANRSYAATTLLGDVTGSLCVGDPHLVPFVLDHLCRLHLRSPDKKTRELAARSIGAVVPFVDEGRLSEYISHTLLPASLEEVASHPTTFRHGALLAISEVVVACENLSEKIKDYSDEGPPGMFLNHFQGMARPGAQRWIAQREDFGCPYCTLIRNVVPKLEKARLYRGRGGEMIRAAACSLVQAVFYARSCIPLKPNTIPRYIQSINSSIRHFTAAVQIAAAEALMALVVCRPGEATDDEITKAEADYVKKLEVTDENVAARRGYLLALAVLTRAREAPPQPEVVSLFIREATAWPEHPISKDVVDAETRRWAVVGLLAVAEKGGSEVAAKVVRALVRCMVIDYATDTRGDVGRWIRQDAARGVSALVALALAGGLSSAWREALLADETLAGLIAASVSRLDHVRVVALRGIEDIAMGRRRQEGGAFALVGAVGRWLEALDFKLVQVKKTLYVDGHERPDVVADRARLAKQLDELKPLILTVDDETLEVKPNPQASFILVSQDEKIHHSNDQQKRYWSDGTNTVLPKKSQGRTIMTSDFLSEVFGFIKFSDHDSHSPGKRVYESIRKGYEAPPRIQVYPPVVAEDLTESPTWPTLWGGVLSLYREQPKMNPFLAGLRAIGEFPEARDKLTILSSLVSSAGSLSHAVSRDASAALTHSLKNDDSLRADLAGLLLLLRRKITTVAVFPTRADRDSRFAVPWLTTLELLLDRELLSLGEDQVAEVTKAILSECRGSRNVGKLRECAACLSTLYFGMLSVKVEARTAIKEALFGRLLCHGFPKVRHATAKVMYEKSLQCAREEADDETFDMIIETDWTEDKTAWEEVHSKICSRVGVQASADEEVPISLSAPSHVFGYADFVKEEYR